MVESKSLDFSKVDFTYLSLSTVDPKSLDFSLKILKILSLGCFLCGSISSFRFVFFDLKNE